MPIGTGTFHPSAGFSFPRSYVYKFLVAQYGDSASQSYTTFRIDAPPPDPTFAIVVMLERTYLWNSGRTRLDQVITDFYYKAGGVGPAIPLPFTLSYGISPLTKKPALLFEWFSGPPDFKQFNLPAQPSDYWLPLPYG